MICTCLFKRQVSGGAECVSLSLTRVAARSRYTPSLCGREQAASRWMNAARLIRFIFALFYVKLHLGLVFVIFQAS